MISMEIMKRSRYLPVRMSNSLIWRQEVEAIMISNWLQEGWQLTHSRPATIDGKFKFWWAGKLPSSVWPRALGGLQEKRCKYGSERVMWLVIFLLRWPGPALRLAEWVELHLLHTEYDQQRRGTCWPHTAPPLAGLCILRSPREAAPAYILRMRQINHVRPSSLVDREEYLYNLIKSLKL